LTAASDLRGQGQRLASALGLTQERVSEGKGEGDVGRPARLDAQGLRRPVPLRPDLGLEAAGGTIDAVGPAAGVDRGGKGGQVVAGRRRFDSGRGQNVLGFQQRALVVVVRIELQGRTLPSFQVGERSALGVYGRPSSHRAARGLGGIPT
jgi:hypothetical protein